MHKEAMAMVIAWPETTARGDDRWYSVLKNMGLVKNLNFKVGHAAIVLIDKDTGILYYYDFGRYITPRGKGRARSCDTDPKLELTTKATIENGKILNLEEILLEMDVKKEATHGLGPMYFSITDHLDFRQSKQEADKWVLIGSTPYGALAKGNNSCSRYVWQVFKAGKTKKTPDKWTSYLPHETLFPSPMSNVVNATSKRELFIYDNKRLKKIVMNRWRSLLFFIQQVGHSFHPVKSKQLPDDQHLGYINEPVRPVNIPAEAQWLGGIGEGAWYHLEIEKGICITSRFNHKGELEYKKRGAVKKDHLRYDDHQFQYDSHYLFTTLSIKGQIVRLHKIHSNEFILNEHST
ncbi:MAG: hypothetical protein IPI60_04080 [Saprospiraceae bacterium]|nr:hypothetical protein [Saprospiraceae bacterium]